MGYAFGVDSVAQALADPIRRTILVRLRDEVATAGQIAAWFSVSRPAVSRHLRVLRAAKLVRDQARGREREYRVDLQALTPLEVFLRELRQPGSRWQRRFDALDTEVMRVRARRRTRAARRKTA